MKPTILALFLSLAFPASLLAQMKPATKPAAAPGDALMGEMRVQTLKGITYLHIDNQTSLATMHPIVEPTIMKLMLTVKDAHLLPAGPLMFIYRGVTANPNQKFTLEIGIPVNDDAQVPAGLKKTKAEEFKCATMLYSGPVSRLGEAHRRLYGDLFGAGLMPVGVTRELYLYWEDLNSPNNVIQIQVQVQ